MTIPEPAVHTTRMVKLTYSRPRIGGWPLVMITSYMSKRAMKLEPAKIIVQVLCGQRSAVIQRVTIDGRWVDGGRQVLEDMDLPGKTRHHRTLAPDWVQEIAAHALARAQKE